MLFDAHDSETTTKVLEAMFKHHFVVAVPIPRICLRADGDLIFYEWLKQHTQGDFNIIMSPSQFGSKQNFSRGFESKHIIVTFESRDDAIAFRMSYHDEMLLDDQAR